MIIPKFWVQAPALLFPGRKPNVGTLDVDKEHWATRGLEAWVVFGSGRVGYDVLNKRLLNVYPNSTRPEHAIKNGEHSRYFQGITDNLAYGSPNIVDPSYGGPRSCVIRMFIPSSTTAGVFGTYSNAGTQGNSNYRLYAWTSNQLLWDYGESFPTGIGRLSMDYSAQLGRWANWVFVSEGVGGSFKAGYADGKLVRGDPTCDGPKGGTDWFGFSYPIGKLVLGAASDVKFHGWISDWRSYKRVLTPDEIRELEADYWGALLPG